MFHISVTRIRHIYFLHYNICIQYKLWYTVITTYYMHVLYINSFYSPSTSRTFHVTCFTSHSMKSLSAVEPIIFDPIQSETCLLQPFVKPIGHWQFSLQLKRLNYCLRKISFLLCRGRYLPTTWVVCQDLLARYDRVCQISWILFSIVAWFENRP